MIQRLSEEEIVTKWNMDTDNTTERNEIESYKYGFRSAESIYTPQIEKLEELDQANIRALRTQAKEIEKLQGEIATLRSLVGQDNLAVLDKLIDAQKEIATLTAKHERLVKGLKDIQNIPISLNSGYVRYVIESIITESEGE